MGRSTRRVSFAALSLVWLMGTPASALGIVSTTDAETSCLESASATWSSVELDGWEAICRREIADFSNRPTGGDVMSAAFVRDILVEDPYVAALGNRQVRLRGISVRGDLGLEGETVPRGFAFVASRFSGSVSLRQATVQGWVDFSGSTFADELDISSATVRGPLDLDEQAELGSLRLSGSRIEGNVDLSSSVASGVIDANNATVEGSLLLRGGHYGSFSATASEIRGSLDAPQSTFDGLFNFTGANVLDWVWLNDGAFLGPVDGRWATIDGSIVTTNSTFLEPAIFNSISATGTMFMDGSEFDFLDMRDINLGGGVTIDGGRARDLRIDTAEVRTDLLLKNGGFGAVTVTDVQLGGDLEIYGSTFEEGLDLRGADIGGSISFVGREGETTAWGPEAVLDLRVARVEALDESPSAWPSSIRLDGFEYRLATGAVTSSSRSFASRDVDWYLDWLARDTSGPDSGGVFSRQPYRQLETVLRDVGRGQVADQVAIARLDRERDAASGLAAFLGWIDSTTIRYGYEPERALYGAFALWVAGSLIARREQAIGKLVGISSPTVFSLDRLIPLVRFSQKNEDFEIADLSAWGRWYFHFHLAAGYMLGVLLVTALARFTQT